MKRPTGFHVFVRDKDYHSVYLITTEQDVPVKIGIAADPRRRFEDIQAANFLPLRLDRFWWMAGREVTARIEKAFKDHFAEVRVRGEWFEVDLSEAEKFILKYAREIRTWAINEDEMIERMMRMEKQQVDRMQFGG